ncbi:hypothetical protein TREES_T100011444 [Tupaia chinensis]|uniref:Uncharacterized protein n=1 Tax=Tupaia chinensis TaxID=246437 RepID=L9L893_TUPCH|nr:hypothetical protein TREES_T100011444 [Tupaia chinensis]
MHKQYSVHFTQGARTPAERYFLDPELGHQKGCCPQWRHVPAAPQAHGPGRPTPQSLWQLAYHGHQGRGGSWRRGPQPATQQQRQPQPPPHSPLRQRFCPVHGSPKGPPTTSAAPMGPACAPQLPPASPTTALAMASSGPALPSAAGTLLEPREPSAARPQPGPVACSSFTFSSGARPGFLGARPSSCHPATRFHPAAGSLAS